MFQGSFAPWDSSMIRGVERRPRRVLSPFAGLVSVFEAFRPSPLALSTFLNSSEAAVLFPPKAINSHGTSLFNTYTLGNARLNFH